MNLVEDMSKRKWASQVIDEIKQARIDHEALKRDGCTHDHFMSLKEQAIVLSKNLGDRANNCEHSLENEKFDDVNRLICLNQRKPRIGRIGIMREKIRNGQWKTNSEAFNARLENMQELPVESYDLVVKND